MDYEVEEGDSLKLFIDLVEYVGDWGDIPIEGVISIEIIYTSAAEPESELSEDESVPGFPMILAIVSILGALVGYKEKEIRYSAFISGHPFRISWISTLENF